MMKEGGWRAHQKNERENAEIDSKRAHEVDEDGSTNGGYIISKKRSDHEETCFCASTSWLSSVMAWYTVDGVVGVVGVRGISSP